MKDNLSNIEDQLLVMAARDGDAEAVKKLVSRWQKKLWRYVHRRTSNSQVTWDITQQCWLEIIKGIRRLNDPACFRAWVYRIATNKSIDWLKNNSKEQHIKLDSIAVDYHQNEDDLRVKELLRKLKNDSRTVLSLYYFEELSVAEISIALNVKPGTVKSRLFTAREELKELWEEYFGD
ncbi:MAG: RNA polymerase sigma factor [Planctomycetota bacterium]|jgi:RNA polymerase sigma-70 factor (ECF subfamily)